MSAETFRVPVLSRGARDWDLKEAPAHYKSIPGASITVLTGGVEHDTSRNITRVELRTGAWWSCRVELDDAVLQQPGSPSAAMLAWMLAGDPTPEIHKNEMRDLALRNELLSEELRKTSEALYQERKRANELAFVLYGHEE